MLSPILSHGYIQVCKCPSYYVTLPFTTTIQLDYDTATETALEKAVQTTDLVILAESTSTSQMQQMQGMTYNPLVKHSLDRRGIILVNENGLPETLENTKLREICQGMAAYTFSTPSDTPSSFGHIQRQHRPNLSSFCRKTLHVVCWHRIFSKSY